MKSQFLFALTLITLFISQHSNAMAKRPYIDSEYLHDAHADQSFNLTAKDGSRVSFNKDQAESSSMISFSLDKKKGNFLVFKTRGKEIYFKISSSVEDIKSINALSRLQILQNLSGQNLAIKFKTLSERTSMGEDQETTESCSIEKVARRCHDDYEYDRETHKRGAYRGEVCETITISEPGYRTVRTTVFATTTQVQMEMIDTSLRTVFTGRIDDYKEWGPRSEGLCMSR